jgi:ferric-dicitrate binding protein FerR (iron transport regulator)
MNDKRVSDQVSEAAIDFIENNLTEEQAKELIKWVEEDKDNISLLCETEHIWNSFAVIEKKVPDISSAWNLVIERIEDNDSRPFPPRQLTVKISSLLKIAASFLLLLLAGTGGFLFLRKPVEKVTGSFFEAEAPRGSRSVITLPDKSTIWLNSGTKLTYSRDFGVKARDIVLEGEAFFSIAENKKVPFRVMTRELCITALGTSFNVKAYSEEDFVETTIETGEVKIEQINTRGRNSIGEMVLKANQKVVYLKNTGLLANRVKEKTANVEERKIKLPAVNRAVITFDSLADTHMETSWKDSKWIFKSESLKKMAIILERRYDINISFRDTVLSSYKFTGTIREETLNEVLKALCMAAPIRYEIDSNIVFLYEDVEKKIKYKKQHQ